MSERVQAVLLAACVDVVEPFIVIPQDTDRLARCGQVALLQLIKGHAMHTPAEVDQVELTGEVGDYSHGRARVCLFLGEATDGAAQPGLLVPV